MAAPASPSSGKPQLPKISSQLTPAFNTPADSTAQSTMRVCSSAERCERSVAVSNAGIRPGPAMRR